MPPSISSGSAAEQHPPGVHCSRTLYQRGSNSGLATKKKGRGWDRIRLMFKAACEHEEVLDPGFCGGARAHSRHPRAIAPRGISDGAVHTPHALIHVLYGGATSGGSEAAMHTSVSAPRYGTMSRTFLHVASASLSYCKAGNRRAALSDSAW